MTRDEPGHSRRSFLRSTATTATTTLAASAAATTSLAGCAALPGDDEGPSPPDYDEQATAELVREPFPNPPVVFPVDIPDRRFRAHETRARELLDAVPTQPDVPNEVIANRIARQRRDLADRLGEMADAHTPRDRLGHWRYYRDHAAEVWGSYVSATGQYTPADFRTRFDRLCAAYNAFDGTWNYRGSDPAAALIVHHAIEELVSRGLDGVLTTGPFPTDPQAAVFEAGHMIQAHERAAANLADARAFRRQSLTDAVAPQSHRLTFAATTDRLRHPAGLETHYDPYSRALDDGRQALDADIGAGPASTAFEHARRYANDAEWDVRQARNRNDPATATIQAARYRYAHRTFVRTVDAIYADEITWPDDLAGLRALRRQTIQSLETAWTTDPQPLAVELTAHATGILRYLGPRRGEEDLDDRDLARYVGTLHYARRYADGVPDLTTRVREAVTTT